MTLESIAMQRVLIDTSVLLDLVLYYQVRHRRNRSVASSAAAAIESLIIYEHPTVEEPSATGILKTGGENRFLGFYCDDSWPVAVNQFRALIERCEMLSVSPVDTASIYDSAVSTMAEILSPVADPDDLRAYELYDYLPYHLGEDPTALECQVLDPSVVDLDEIQVENISQPPHLLRAAEVLKSMQHPARAAWALPLLRLFYYQSLQAKIGAHFVPHATKTTIAFGRESETVSHRRLLDYCTEVYKARYLNEAKTRLADDLMIYVPVPASAERILLRTSEWNAVIDQISFLREDQNVVEYRRILAKFISILEGAASFEGSRDEIKSTYLELEKMSQQWVQKWQLSKPYRYVRLALPIDGNTGGESHRVNWMLMHDLFAATGISRVQS